MTKTCTKCGKEKSLEEFPVEKRYKCGFHPHCKACRSKIAKQWRLKNPVRRKQYEKEYFKRPEVVKRQKENFLKSTYGLTFEEYESLWSKQDGKCAICLSMLQKGRKVHIDHCHKNGKIRGLLCAKCNHGLGLFNDDPILLMVASDYASHDNL
jgi:hypothetical protein